MWVVFAVTQSFLKFKNRPVFAHTVNVHADLMSAGEIWTDSEIDRDLLCLLSDGRYDELRLRLERLRRVYKRQNIILFTNIVA